MDEAFQAAASAMNAVTRQFETATANAVNAGTPGYLNRVTTMRSFASALDKELGRPATLLETTEETAFRPGELIRSASPLAVALDGPGFLAVQTPDGIVYTRNGDLALSPDGTLVTRAGYPVLDGSGAPIRSAQGKSQPRFDAESGGLVQDEAALGAPRIVDFERPEKLERVGETLFRAPPEAGERAAGTTRLVPGMLEMPPERAVSGLVGLIAAGREFEAAQRVMAAVNRTYEKLTGRGG